MAAGLRRDHPDDQRGEELRTRWPGGARCAVALAFDLDGPTGSAMLDGSLWHNPELFGIGGYGPFRALPRILDLLDEHRVPATFFTPSWVLEQWPERGRAIIERGHEVAHHGHRHECYFDLTVAEQLEVLAHSQRVFQNVLGETAIGFRTPSGDWHPETTRLLVEHGFSYSSSMRDDDLPYRHLVGGRPSELIEIPGHWDFDDYAYLAYQQRPAYPSGQDRIAGYDTTLANWCAEFDGVRAEGLCLTTLLHPKVSGKPGRILLLDELLRYLREPGDVWFGTCREVAEWWRATHPLISPEPEPAPVGAA